MSPATVVVTSSAGAFPGLVEALRAIPVTVEDVPLMSFAPPLDWTPVDAAARNLHRYAAIAFTSPRSARAFVDRLESLGVTVPTGTAAWAAGAGTRQALGGFAAVRQPDERAVAARGAAAALADALVQSGLERPVLFPCGDLRRDELPARLRNEGIAVDEVVCYRSVLAGETEARGAAERAQVLVVASPSVVDLLARACPSGVRPALVVVGPTTAAAARASGWAPARVASSPTAEALAGAVRAVLAAR
ncbi:MAG TPA: uroporphyrinogen-III synthase [Gemmatimonadales bacterium]|nr:uroporphyrinogen-III synthase [Gemmatimonadales bacterium]